MKKTPLLQLHNRQKKVRLRLPLLQRKLEKALELLPAAQLKKFPTSIEISFISIREMKMVHGQFLKDDSETDVITFPYGEILICPEVAKKQAKQYGQSIERETLLYALHGLLHLLGYRDKTARDFQQMKKKQEEWLEKIIKSH